MSTSRISKPTKPHEKAATTLWIVNQYAVRMSQAGITRHAGLATGMKGYGIDSVIIACPRSYMSGAVEQTAQKPEEDCEPPFIWLSAPNYSGNGAGRIVNMTLFALKTALVPLTTRKLPRPEVVMGSSPSLFAAAAAWALAKATRAKYVLEIRDLHPKSITALGLASKNHPYVRIMGILERFLYRRADLIVSPLQGMSAHVRRTIGVDIECLWVPNYANMAAIPEPAQLKDDPRPFRVVYTGAHGVANSLETVLEAAEALRDEEVEFWFYGGGMAKEDLIKQAQRKGLNNVHFEDPVPKNQVTKIQQSADALLLVIRDSPLWEDGFSPNKLYDYLAAGRPVIFAAKVPHDPVTENAAGITVAPQNPRALADGILDLMSTPASERQAMGQRGRDLIRNSYDRPKVAAKLAQRLIRLVDSDE